MATPPSSQPSFSPRRKWSIAFSVTLATVAVFALLVGINYLSSRHFFKRFYLSADTRVQLSPRTLSVLKMLTNDVNVTVYYDKEDSLYGDIISLLREYQAHSRKLSVQSVDYLREPGAAAAMKAKYNLGSATNKDFIIFDLNGRTTVVDGSWLATQRFEQSQSTNEAGDPIISLNRKRTAFNGEMLFTAKLFALTQGKPMNAYFLLGHGERSPHDTNDVQGCSKLAEIFHRNYVNTETLNNLFGTNTVPLDCNLLVIDGPQGEFQEIELEKISQYLDQGGRLFALFDNYSVEHNLGLEKVLAKWNVRVTHSTVHDPDYGIGNGSAAFSVAALTLHDVMKPVLGLQLEIVLPRPIERIKVPSMNGADEPQVTELAFSSTNSVLGDNPSAERRSYPLMVAVEKGVPKGVATERGATRMLIAGDSIFLGNQVIDFRPNQDFADSAVNWLLERTTFLEGVGPRPITQYQLVLNQRQINAVKGLLLGAIPGGILLLGGLVWLRRRK
jgi:ABC-2 type transport system permease protein